MSYHTLAVPIGTIIDFAGANVPDGWLECDGSAVSRTAYAALFAVLGTTWGAGNGSTTFNLPNLGGRVAIGKGNRSVGATGGAETHTLTVDEMPGHDHSFTGSAVTSGANSRGHTHTYNKPNASTNAHTLTVSQIPSHTHAVKETHGSATSRTLAFDYDYAIKWSTAYTNRNEDSTGPIRYTGGGGSHSHGIGTASTDSGDESQNHTHSVTAAGTVGSRGGAPLTASCSRTRWCESSSGRRRANRLAVV